MAGAIVRHAQFVHEHVLHQPPVDDDPFFLAQIGGRSPHHLAHGRDPFPDGLEVLIAAGVKAVVQPGGSIRDNLVIEAAEKAGMTVYLTGTRHFYH